MKREETNFVNLGFPTMIRKARWSAEACGSGQWRGLDAIIYSAFAVEAFVNDFATMGGILEIDRAPYKIRMAVKSLQRAEKNRKSTMDKTAVLYQMLSGFKPNKGSDPLKRLSLLFELRDKIVHSKADIVTGTARTPIVASLIARLDQQGELIPKNMSRLYDWRCMIDQSPNVANWALETARSIAKWIRDACPDSAVKESWLEPATGPRSAMFLD